MPYDDTNRPVVREAGDIDAITRIPCSNGATVLLEPAWRYFRVKVVLPKRDDYDGNRDVFELLAAIPGVRAYGEGYADSGSQILKKELTDDRIPIRYHIDNTEALYSFVIGLKESEIK